MIDRLTMTRANPGIRNASWNKPRESLQDIQEIAGAREWVEPVRTLDDREGEERVVEATTGIRVVDGHVERIDGEGVRVEARIPPITSVHTITPSAVIVLHCLLCQRSESECSILVELHSGHICDQCTEEAIDLVRQEIPKRRLRLAMERMLAGDVSIETVEMIEKLSGGKDG